MFVSGVVYVLEVAPSISSGVPPVGVDTLYHWYVFVPSPDASTVNVAVFPSSFCCAVGCVVICVASVTVSFAGVVVSVCVLVP